MRAIGKFMGVGLIALAAPQGAFAADETPVCTAQGTLTPDLLGWSMLAFRDAAANPAGLSAARLATGEAVLAKLAATPALAYVRRPEKPGDAASFGGMLQWQAATRGTYRVVLGTHAWLDLVAARGGSIASVAHAKGPACTGIRKMVDFVVEPGTYTVQIAGSPTPTAQVMVIRLP